MAHPEEPTLPEDTGQRKNKNYTRYYQIIFYYASVQILYDIDTANWYGD